MFKGGTCLRKCWFETYRFSEDLDFTVAESDLDIERLRDTFAEIASWLDDRCGLGLIIDDGSFRQRQNKRGNPTIEGRLGYLGPLGMPTPPKVKLDLTADEVIVRRLDVRPVLHPHLPSFDAFWSRLDDIFAWLDGSRPLPQLPEIQPTEPVTDWRLWSSKLAACAS